MADNLGPMAWLFLPENEQVQYLLKIALRAENPYGLRNFVKQIFSAKQFSAAIGAAHFPADGTAIDACAAAIFTFFKTYALKKQDGRCKDKENLIRLQEIWIKY